MAYIYKPKPQKSYRDRERSKYYNNSQYRKSRDWFMQTHPLCTECLKDNVVSPAEHCHHVLSPFDPNLPEEERWRRLMDENNFQALCRFHHQVAHGTARQSDVDEYNEMVKSRKNGSIG